MVDEENLLCILFFTVVSLVLIYLFCLLGIYVDFCFCTSCSCTKQVFNFRIFTKHIQSIVKNVAFERPDLVCLCRGHNK